MPDRTTYRRLILATLLGLLLPACSPFSHLTTVENNGLHPHGPEAQDCGGCHIEQYQEWQGSAHAQAYRNPRYQAILAEGVDDACLGCHVPATVPAGGEPPAPRRYNLADGVSCLACHLREGRMLGPEAGSALANPHPIQAEPEFFRGAALCGSCHTEAYADWQASRQAGPALPTCQECHMPRVFRTATQGSNLFSRILVSFEKARPTRRHSFAFTHLAEMNSAVRLALADWQPNRADTLGVTVTNLLPHRLPAGYFRNRPARLQVTLLDREEAILARGQIPLSAGDTPLAAGEARLLAVPLSPETGPTKNPAAQAAVELILGSLAHEPELVLARARFSRPESR
ncbi:multiheme c-type cytochrome [Thiovibrio sp. JS02]